MRPASSSMWAFSSHSVIGSGSTIGRVRRHSGGMTAKKSSSERAPVAASIAAMSSGVCGR